MYPGTDIENREGIDDLFDAWVDAVRRRDAAEVARLHLPGGVLQLPGAPGARGRDSIHRRCLEWLCRDSCAASFTLAETRHYEAADIATCNGRFTLAWPLRSNGDEDRGRLLLVAEKEPDRWGLRFSGLFSDAFLSRLASMTRSATR